MKIIQNYLYAFVTLILISIVSSALLYPFLSKTGALGASSFGEGILILFLIGLPYCLGMAAYLLFWQDTYDVQKTFSQNTLPITLIFMTCLVLILSLQAFTSKKILLQSLPKASELKARMLVLQKQERIQQENLLSRYKHADLHELPTLMQDAQILIKRYPHNVIIERIYLNSKKQLNPTSSVQKQYNQASLLEKKAIEAQNNLDYTAAALYYQKIIEMLPGREYVRDRQTYAGRMALCLIKAKDPNARLTEDEMHRRSLQQQLNHLRKMMKVKPLRDLLPQSKEIYLHYPENPQVTELYQDLKKRLDKEDFFLHEAAFIQKHIPSQNITSNITLDLQDLFIEAKQGYIFPDKIFLKEVTYRTPKQTLTYPYAKLYKNKIFLQNSTTTPAKIIHHKTSLKNVLQSVELLRDTKQWVLFLSLSAYHLHLLKPLTFQTFQHNRTYWEVLYSYQLSLPFFIAYIFLLSMYYSVKNQQYLLHPISFLYWIIQLTLHGLIYFLCLNLITLWQVHIHVSSVIPLIVLITVLLLAIGLLLFKIVSHFFIKQETASTLKNPNN